MKLFYVSTYNDSFSHILKTLSTINKTRETSNFLYRSNSHLAADTQCGLASSLKGFPTFGISQPESRVFYNQHCCKMSHSPVLKGGHRFPS